MVVCSHHGTRGAAVICCVVDLVVGLDEVVGFLVLVVVGAAVVVGG